MHHAYVAGLLSAQQRFAGRVRIDALIGSYLPRSRDMLTARFLDSGADYMLCVDSDIGWSADDVQKLLDTRAPFVSGVYCKKNATRGIPAKLISQDGNLARCEHVPAGFLLLERGAVQSMWDTYESSHRYDFDGKKVVGLWHSSVVGDGEDVAFCRKWRALGEQAQCLMRTDVRLRHFGGHCYQPGDELKFQA
jgi:hypothetical protein